MSPKGDQAGRSAQEHFNELYKPWRKKFRRRFSIVLAAAVGMVLPLGLLFPKFALLYWVLLAGTLFGTYASMADSPPEWIDNWRRGAEGERKTAKRLKKLPTGEWRVLHDLIPGDWNIDHIAVGRSGVYLLDSKALRGEIHIDGETLTAKRGSFDVDHWSNDRIGASINRRARRIRQEIRERSRANPG